MNCSILLYVTFAGCVEVINLTFIYSFFIGSLLFVQRRANTYLNNIYKLILFCGT